VSPKAASVSLGAPVQFVSASGVRIALSPVRGRATVASANGRVSGAGILNVGGGGLPQVQLQLADYAYARGALDARAALKAGLDFGPVRGAKVDVSGRLQTGERTARFAPAACLSVSAERVDMGEAPIVAPAGRLCPLAGRPLFALNAQGWRFDGRIEDAGADLPASEVHVYHVAALARATGGTGRAIAADLQLQHVDLTDTAAQTRLRRFNGREPSCRPGDGTPCALDG
jgi:hypothetical protein